MSARFVWAAKTDVGALRRHNEDCLAVGPHRDLFVVCDGMGGHARGEVASSTACQTILGVVSAAPSSSVDTAQATLVSAIRCANDRVFGLGRGEEKRPGTTVAALYFVGDHAVVAHVGDSRVFRLRGGELHQLTRDHSYANALVELGVLKPEQVEDFPHRHLVTRAVGLGRDVEVDVQASEVVPGDIFLVASDGLEVLAPGVVQACLALPPAAAAERLIALSLAEGAPDNVTVLVVRVTEPISVRKKRVA